VENNILQKILHVITGLGMGGAERVVADLADGMYAAGHRVTIVYLTGPAITLPHNHNVTVVGLGMRNRRDMFGALWRLRRIIKAVHPNVVHAHMFHAIILTRIVRVFVKIPRLVGTVHSSVDGGWGRTLTYKITQFLGDYLTNVSQEATEKFTKSGAAKKNSMITIANGIDTNKFKFSTKLRKKTRVRHNIALHDRLILAVGRLENPKNYPNLLRALKVVNDKQPTTTFIVGSGSLRTELERLAHDSGIFDRIRFLGARHDVAALMCAADVFVLSSDYEGFGLVVAEAMACGCIVVATNCGGVREVISDAGYLVPPRDHNKLAQSIISALNMNADARKKLADLARKRIVAHYSQAAMCENYMTLYKGNESP